MMYRRILKSGFAITGLSIPELPAAPSASALHGLLASGASLPDEARQHQRAACQQTRGDRLRRR